MSPSSKQKEPGTPTGTSASSSACSLRRSACAAAHADAPSALFASPRIMLSSSGVPNTSATGRRRGARHHSAWLGGATRLDALRARSWCERLEMARDGLREHEREIATEIALERALGRGQERDLY